MRNAPLQPQAKQDCDQLERQQRQRQRQEGKTKENDTDHEGGSPVRLMRILISVSCTQRDRTGKKREA
jgi:hypothetical protein